MMIPVYKHDFPVSLFCFRLFPRKFYVFDRTYNGLSFWYKIQTVGSHFVINLKKVSCHLYLQFIKEAKKSSYCKILFEGIYKPTPSSLTLYPVVPPVYFGV